MRNFLTNRSNDLGFNFFDDAFENFFKPVFYDRIWGGHRLRRDYKCKSETGCRFFYPSDEFFKEEMTIEARIIDIEEDDAYISLDLKINSVNGKKYFKKVKLTLYDTEHDLSVGNTVRFNGFLEPFASEGSFDFASYYTSSGFSASYVSL